MDRIKLTVHQLNENGDQSAGQLKVNPEKVKKEKLGKLLFVSVVIQSVQDSKEEITTPSGAFGNIQNGTIFCHSANHPRPPCGDNNRVYTALGTFGN